jgi:uncharacterized RDD family membrane protein YckC
MQQGFDSGPPTPVAMPISEPPVAPVALSFDSFPEAPGSDPAPQGRRPPPSPARLLLGWTIDLTLIAGLFAVQVLAAAALAGRALDWPGTLSSGGRIWLALGLSLAAAWSWIFIGLCGRTPGMAITGQRLQSLPGGRPGPGRALLRALLAVALAVPGLFGFVAAFFDPQRRTLHDRICGCASVVD